jgi:hypothetical protein
MGFAGSPAATAAALPKFHNGVLLVAGAVLLHCKSRKLVNKEQEFYMAGFTRLIESIATLAFAGMLAGCAAALPNAQSQSQSQPAGAPIAQKMKCPADNGVSVHPCSVTLNAQKTSATVKTRGPKGGSFTIRDNHCTTKDLVNVMG